jgi:hypothetical protein
VSRKKALKRKLGKKVLAGKLTVGEARARLGREMAQRVQKSARPAWPAQPQPQPAPRYQDDDDYIRAAFRPLPRPSVIKARKPAGGAGPDPQVLRRLAQNICDPSWLPASFVGPPMMLKQLSGPERAMVAELRRELDLAGHDPVRREHIRSQLADLERFTPGGV